MDEDLVAQSRIFMLHRGNWKSYEVIDWTGHRDRPIKTFAGHPDWIDSEEEEDAVDWAAENGSDDGDCC